MESRLTQQESSGLGWRLSPFYWKNIKGKRFLRMKDLFGDKVILLAGELLVDHDELSSTMIHLGIVGNDFLKSVLIQNCKAMILLSQSEANPLVIQEAIAHHKHIYVSDIPAHRELAFKFKNI